MPPHAADQFITEAVEAPLLQEKGQSALCSGAAGSLIVEELDNLNDDVVRLIRLDEPSKIRRYRETSGSHLAANQNMESRKQPSVHELRCRHKRDVL